MTNWNRRAYKLSINKGLHNNNKPDDVRLFTDGFERVDFTIQQLADSIKNGFSYCIQLTGLRKASNFLCADLVSVDIDGSRTYKELINDPLYLSSATLLHTTASFTSENQHFRIIFGLEHTIYDAKNFAALARALALHFNGDGSSTDAARLFFGNTKAKITQSNKGLSSSQIHELIEIGKKTNVMDKVLDNNATISSAHHIEPNLLIQSHVGNERTLDEFEPMERVFCPFHHETSSSAIVIANQYGENGIHCKTCGCSFWLKDTSADYDFFRFDEYAKETADFAKKHQSFGPLSKFMVDHDQSIPTNKMIEGLERANIYYQNERYLGLENLWPVFDSPGVTFIKSPKGTGKTEFLKRLIDKKQGSVLLVGHRRSLIRQSCKRLGLNCYLDEPDEFSKHNYFTKIGVCLDSIGKISPSMKYDWILIDESEQVLAHFLSDTLRKKRNDILHHFQHLLRNAKQTIVLDADINWTSFFFLTNWAKGIKQQNITSLVINEYEEPKGNIQLYASKNELLGDLLQAIKQGKRCYVASNNKKLIDSIYVSIPRTDCITSQIMRVTSATTNDIDKSVTRFLENPSSEALNYKVILASPSISSGVDISFDGNESIFENVYGFFEPLILTHFECDQQLARVRHPKEIKVFISGRRFHFESNLEIIKDDLLESEMMQHLINGYTDDGPTYREDDPLLELACSIISQQRATKNDLKGYFVEYRKRQGWEIETIESDLDLELFGKIAFINGNRIVNAQYVAALMSAKQLNGTEYNEILDCFINDKPVSTDESLAYTRETIQRFFQQPISEVWIKKDDRGRFRRRVENYVYATDNEYLSTETRQAVMDKEWKEPKFKALKNDHAKCGLLLKAIETAGIYENGAFDTDKIICAGDLNEFTKFLQENKAIYETQTGKELARDILKKPISTVNNILKEFGLKFGKAKTRRIDGGKTYFYRLSAAVISEMEHYAKMETARRKNQNAEMAEY